MLLCSHPGPKAPSNNDSFRNTQFIITTVHGYESRLTDEVRSSLLRTSLLSLSSFFVPIYSLSISGRVSTYNPKVRLVYIPPRQ